MNRLIPLNPAARIVSVLPVLLLVGMLAPGCDREDLTGGPDVPVPVPVVTPPPPSPGDVKLNELVVINGGSVLDDQGDTPPWLELYNPTDVDIDLEGAFLSDDFLNPEKWTLPGGGQAVIPARGYLILYLDGKADTLGGLHANFEVREQRLQVLLWDKGGQSGDEFFFDTRSSVADAPLGRVPYATVEEIGEFLRLETATPLAENSGPATGTGPVEAPFIRGDVDGSGNVSFLDSTILNRIVQGLESLPACQDTADVNDDGVVDTADFTLLTRALFDGSVAIPAPFPAAGLDPTPDGLSCPL